MSEQIFHFDAAQWEKLKTVTKSNARNREITFCSDFTFCQNQTSYTRSVINQDASATYGRRNRYTDTPDRYSRDNALIPSDKATYSKNYGRTVYSRYTAGYGRLNYTQRSVSYRANYNQSGVYTKTYSEYSKYSRSSYVQDTYSRSSYSRRARYRASYTDTGYYQGGHEYYTNIYTDETAYRQVSVCNDVLNYTRVSKYHEELAFATHLPSVPILLGTENGNIPVLSETAKIALYSYDKDIETSNDSILKTVRYDVYIQQIKDKYGVRITQAPLTKIKSDVPEPSPGSGLSFDFDTTAYQDGYYRIIAIARNAPKTYTFSISGDESKKSVSGTYYMQDIPTDSVTVNGAYDGVSLISGLSFAKGETNDPKKNANDRKVMSGYIYDMYSVSEVRIRQNRPAFFEAGIKNSTNTLNMIFAGLKDDNITPEETRGAYNPSSKVLKVYGSNEIAGGDDYISLRGWDKGAVATIEIGDNDTEQWLEVVGELVNKTTGEVVRNSRVIAQFPTNITVPNAYVTTVKSGGSGITHQGYLYWPATFFHQEMDTLRMDEYIVQLTVYEYADAKKSSIVYEQKYTSSVVDKDGNAKGDDFGFKVDIYDPSLKAIVKNEKNDAWVESVDVKVEASDIPSLGSYAIAGKWQCGKNGDNVWAEFYKNGVLKITGSGEMKDYQKNQDAPWHLYEGQIKVIVFDDDITSIGSYSFQNVKQLRTIKLPKRLESIGAYAFQNYDYLHPIYFNDSIKKIEPTSFYSATNEQNIFYYKSSNLACSNLLEKIRVERKNVILNEQKHFMNLKPYGQVDSYNYRPTSSHEDITASGKKIYTWEFSWGKAVLNEESNKLTVSGSGIRDVLKGKMPWEKGNLADKIKTIEFENGMKYIGVTAFMDTKGLEKVIIPPSVEYIGVSAFRNCKNLTQVEGLEYVKYLDDEAFAGCNRLSLAKLGDKLEVIGDFALRDCYFVRKLNLSLPSISYIGWGAFNGLIDVKYDHTIRILNEAAEGYKNQAGWKAMPITRDNSSKFKEIQITLYDQNKKIVKQDLYSVENKSLDSDLEEIIKMFKFSLDPGQYAEKASLEVSAMDNVGNKTTIMAATNLNIDTTTAQISVDKEPKKDGSWFTENVSPKVTVTKEKGKPIEKVKIIESNSSEFPNLSDKGWNEYDNPGHKFTYKAADVGKETGVKYIHIYVEDGLHDPIKKTIGPYRVDLESPEVQVACDAIKQWKHQTTLTASIKDNQDGSKLKYTKVTWYRSDGTIGGISTKSYLENEFEDNVSIDISIPDKEYDDGIYAVIEVADNADNITSLRVNNIYLDNTMPFVELSPPAENYPNWINETIDTVLKVTKESGSPIKEIQIAEVKDISETTDVPETEWNSISIGNGKKIEYSNSKIGQDSGEHYLHVRINNGIDEEPLEYVFGPYKVDLIKPEVASVDLNLNNQNSDRWVEQYNRAGWYWEPVEYVVYTKDDGGSKIKVRKGLINNSPTLVPISDPNWIDVPWIDENDNTMYAQIRNGGTNYIHTYLKDNAGNENNTNNRNSTAIKIDLDNPVLDYTQTFIGNVNKGVLYGYASYKLKASDATSGVNKVLYAVTDSPTPPAFDVLGDVSPEKFGRTDGWVNITDVAKSEAGYNFDLKAMGHSYVHVYIEDNAGRGINTIPANVLTQDKIHTGETIDPGIEIRPSYLIGLTILDESGKVIVAQDRKSANASFTNIYALKNVSSSAMLKIDYHNYEESSTKIDIDIIDKATGNVVKTITDLVKFELGNTVDGTAKPYINSIFWMDKNGNLLKSGLYEVKAKLYQDGSVSSTVSTYVLLKQNTLTGPTISSEITGNKTNIEITYTEDDFLANMAAQYRSDAFISKFIQNLKDSHPTTYSSKEMSNDSKINEQVHVPSFSNKKWTYKTSTNKQTTIIASIKDAFGNEANTSKVVYFDGNSYTPDHNDENGDKSDGDGTINTAYGREVRNIETPKANNYYIGFKEEFNDTLKKDVFNFLADSNAEAEE